MWVANLSLNVIGEAERESDTLFFGSRIRLGSALLLVKDRDLGSSGALVARRFESFRFRPSSFSVCICKQSVT